jgi:hypothetical protein
VKVWWKSTTLADQYLAWYISYSIGAAACYDSFWVVWTYSAPYTSTYTTITMSSWTFSSTSTMYYSTTRKYTYAPSKLTSKSTLIFTLTFTDTFSTIITISDILTDTIAMTYYTTDIQYSTVTLIIAPSPSIVPKNKCTCVLTLCNKIDLVLLTINNIV